MVFYFVVILSKQNDSFVTMNQHKPKKNCVKRFAAFSAQCLSLLFVLVSSCASSSYIAVYFFCDSFCSVLTTNTDFFPSSSLLSTWRYGERKKRSEMRPNHCCVKKWKENIRPKKWWEIYFSLSFYFIRSPDKKVQQKIWYDNVFFLCWFFYFSFWFAFVCFAFFLVLSFLTQSEDSWFHFDGLSDAGCVWCAELLPLCSPTRIII